jgi:valyl-tRNA synthetase
MDGPAIEKAIGVAGGTVRDLKTGGGSKAAIEKAVGELLALKTKYKEVTGKDFGPPSSGKKKKKSKKGDAAAPAPAPAPAPKKAAAPPAAPAAKKAAPAAAGSKVGQMWLDDEAQTALSYYVPTIGSIGGGGAAAPASGGADAVGAAGEEKLSKKQLKKLAKNGGKTKAPKVKPQWGDGSKKKAEKAKKEAAAAAAPEEVFVNNTPKGEKKIMSEEMFAAYQPLRVEAAWGDWWEKSGFYAVEDVEAAAKRPYEEKFIIVIPPPNVTGSLHLGHALTVAVEDCLVRWHRMCGHVTLWIPGTDHAGIATQSVVEKKLMKDSGTTRHDLGRDAFIKKVWKWKEEYGTKITSQLRFLGTSVDWNREAFTMDTNLSNSVQEAFVRFHEAGIIFRANRLVNWSCHLKSAISDIEVDQKALTGRTMLSVPGHDKGKKYEFGVITSFSYQVENSDEKITVATTRLETMLGDTAVAVHPDDPRYKHLHGKFVVHPFNGRKIPIVLDGELVNMDFGTGAVKITPAHDPNDNECGKRHNLEEITIFNEDGAVNENGGEYAGMMRYDCRVKLEADLKAKGLYVGKEDNEMQIPICSRSGDVIEPMLCPQWYVNCGNMAKRATDAVRDGSLQIIPSFHEATWFRWLDNCHDWCISRQLWWGHRIPAYFTWKKGADKPDKNLDKNYKQWIVARNEDEVRKQAAKVLGCKPAEVEIEQDPDVLDTWFSSGLFPFAVFGWPNPSVDLDAFYPTTLLETGHDILFFWVARMVMMGLQLTDKLPFTKVYLHAMVRDKYGRKMSKSLGNVIDPLEVINGCKLEHLIEKLKGGNLPEKEIKLAIEGQTADFPDGIPECGADALRFGLLAYTIQGRDVNLDISRVVGYRNFCNKLWNVVRFCLSNLGTDFAPPADVEKQLFSGKLKMGTRDKFVLSRLAFCCHECDKYMREYLFGKVTEALYAFWLYDVCDNYLEAIKPIMHGDDKEAKFASQCTLFVCLDYGLRLLHPMMPFVTEELWQRTPGHGVNLPSGANKKDTIMLAPYPTYNASWRSEEVEETFNVCKEVVHSARSMRAEYGLVPAKRPTFYVRASTKKSLEICKNIVDDVKTLAKAGEVNCIESEAPAVSSYITSYLILYLPSSPMFPRSLCRAAPWQSSTLRSRSSSCSREWSTSRPKSSSSTRRRASSCPP